MGGAINFITIFGGKPLRGQDRYEFPYSKERERGALPGVLFRQGSIKPSSAGISEKPEG